MVQLALPSTGSYLDAYSFNVKAAHCEAAQCVVTVTHEQQNQLVTKLGND